jgi:hypothetical protein
LVPITKISPGVRYIADLRADRYRAHAFQLRRHLGGMAEPVAVVDLAGANAGTHQFRQPAIPQGSMDGKMAFASIADLMRHAMQHGLLSEAPAAGVCAPVGRVIPTSLPLIPTKKPASPDGVGGRLCA